MMSSDGAPRASEMVLVAFTAHMMTSATGTEHRGDDLSHRCRGAPDADTVCLERSRLRGCGAVASRDDRAGVAHRLAGWSREAGDVGNNGLRHVRGDVVRRLL